MAVSRPSLTPFLIATNGAMSSNLTSLVTSIQNYDDLSLQFNFTGAPTGTFAVQGSLDYNPGSGGTVLNAGTWNSLTLSPTPSAAGAPASILLNLNFLSFPYMRTTYTATGTGVFTVATVADVSKSLASMYFLINDGNGHSYAIWFKVSGTGAAPSVPGYTNVEQDISTNDTAATIGTALASTIAALNGTASFTTAGTSTITVTLLTSGPWTAPSAGTSGFTVAMTANEGVLDAYVGGKAI